MQLLGPFWDEKEQFGSLLAACDGKCEGKENFEVSAHPSLYDTLSSASTLCTCTPGPLS